MNILNKLTIKHMSMNKKRTIVTIIGVILSTALMVGIGLLFSTLRENSIDSAIRYQGNYHVSFLDVTSKQKTTIEKNSQVKDIYYSQDLGYSLLVNGQNDYKPYIHLLGVDSGYFEEINLIKGRLPENIDEVVIPNHISTNAGVEYEIGDTIELSLGQRYFNDELVTDVSFQAGEILKVEKTKKYKIVGIVERSKFESYSDSGYNIFTKYDEKSSMFSTIYVRYKNISNTYDTSGLIAKTLGFPNISLGDSEPYYRQVQYNDSLLAMYGLSKYNNVIGSISGIMAIILALISIGCIIVIYNSFAISVMERKKQFGLFSSIGATKKQLRKTVFYEAFLVGIVGIPLGVIGSVVGIGTVLAVINHLLPEFFDTALKLSIYPVFIAIPIIFMIFVILLSAFIPSRQASKITPIEAIRQNDDIKIKSKKLKTNRFVKKLFGVEGEIALKNIKRNKRKYRITVASLFISIVLFVSFSSVMEYAFAGANSYVSTPDYDLSIGYNSINDKKQIDEIIHHEQVDKSISISVLSLYTNSDLSNYYSSKMKEIHELDNTMNEVLFITVDRDNYNKMLNKVGGKEEKPILINRYNGVVYSDNSRKSYDTQKFNDKKMNINICDATYETGPKDTENVPTYDCFDKVDDYYVLDEAVFGIFNFLNYVQPVFIVTEDLIKEFGKELVSYHQLLIEAKKYDQVDKVIKEFAKESESIHYYNVAEEMQMTKNLILVVHILVYGFITLVTLIGVTSVFNTINTSIALRRKEFAMLRSMGLTPKGFNKILYFESLFVGLKSLLFALPVAFGVTALLHLSMTGIVSFDQMIIPYKSIVFAIVGVFTIVLITMLYASKKVKKENILDAIREENI